MGLVTREGRSSNMSALASPTRTLAQNHELDIECEFDSAPKIKCVSARHPTQLVSRWLQTRRLWKYRTVGY